MHDKNSLLKHYRFSLFCSGPILRMRRPHVHISFTLCTMATELCLPLVINERLVASTKNLLKLLFTQTLLISGVMSCPCRRLTAGYYENNDSCFTFIISCVKHGNGTKTEAKSKPAVCIFETRGRKF